jgi:hypothetical protein
VCACAFFVLTVDCDGARDSMNSVVSLDASKTEDDGGWNNTRSPSRQMKNTVKEHVRRQTDRREYV